MASKPDTRISAKPADQNPPIRFFRIHLDDQGLPGAPLLVPGSADGVPPTAVALSPDGTRLAYLSELGARTVTARWRPTSSR